MEASGQLYAPAAFPAVKTPMLTSGKETEWVQHPGCGPAWNRTPIPFFFQPRSQSLRLLLLFNIKLRFVQLISTLQRLLG